MSPHHRHPPAQSLFLNKYKMVCVIVCVLLETHGTVYCTIPVHCDVTLFCSVT